MSGIYTVQFNNVNISAVQDLLAIVAHASKQCVLLGFGISQTSDVGDAAEEQLRILIRSGQTVAGSGGTAVTPVPNDTAHVPGGANPLPAGFTARANDTTQAGTGTIVTHYPLAWNVRMAMDEIFPETKQLIFGAGRRLTIELATAPADALLCNGYAVVQEIG